MPKTIDEVQSLLTRHGYTCELMLDVIVATQVDTKVYKSPGGDSNLQILLTFDKPNLCLAVESLRAFDLRKVAHREAALSCIMTATARTPLLRPSLEPEDNIRLRVDCTVGPDGANDDDVLRAIAILPCFADAWFEQITRAMELGKFDASKVPQLNLSRMAHPLEPAAPEKPADGESPAATPATRSPRSCFEAALRAASLSRKPGAGPNRLKVLFEFQKWLDEQRRDAEAGSSRGPTPAADEETESADEPDDDHTDLF